MDGYFVHFFDPDSFQSLPKNIVFMLDVSGSMRLKKLQQLKEAMTTILNSLKPDLDTFLIGYFSKDVQWMNDGDFMPALKNNTADAISQIKQLFTSGGKYFSFWFRLVGFYGMSTVVGYLMQNPFLYIYVLDIYDFKHIL